MASWSGKTKGGPLGYRIFIFLLKHFNIRIAYFVLIFVAFWFFLFSNKQGIRFYFRHVLKYSYFKTQKSIYRNYYIFGQVLLDRIAIAAGFSTKFSFNFEGEHFLHKMAEENTGGILVGAHVGNWEIAGKLLERINAKINILMYDGEQHYIRDLVGSVMRKYNIEIIYIKENSNDYLFKIAEALKNKEIIAMHGDRFLPGTNNAVKNFMGFEAEFPTGSVYLASKYNVPVVYVSAMKEKTTHYHFFATPPKLYKYPANLKTRKQELSAMMDDYIAEMERVVKQYPLQWFNYHQFWKISN
ncbi:MAG: lysophospholipid acyltransferase family protein [Bacteroidetes bacterium]|nr:lysophospholipid acyltransferase family protein [Bacteroidota bacterium]